MRFAGSLLAADRPWPSMKSATKCGVTLAAAHSLVVCVLVAAGLLAGGSLAIPFSLVVAVDLPAILLWVLWLESMGHPGLPENLLIFLLYGVIGGKVNSSGCKHWIIFDDAAGLLKCSAQSRAAAILNCYATSERSSMAARTADA
jgi:hypothetical protein